MRSIMLSDCQVPLSGNMLGDDVALSNFSINTRTLRPGDFYIAIRGENFDGHDYCKEAEHKGAAGLLVSQPQRTRLPQLVVADTRIALGLLGQLWASGFQVPTVAVTGSNGKTTVKELIASILGQLGPVLATEGNLNNDIGVPLTLLRMRQEHCYAVIEMGASHRGEIAYLSELVAPDVAVVTNIGDAHLEGFGSIEGIAAAKSEIYSGIRPDGWAVINADDRFKSTMLRASKHCHIREFGTDPEAGVRLLEGQDLKVASTGKIFSPRFSLLGKHNRMNAAAAIAAAQCMDVQPVTIMTGLANVEPVAGRLERKYSRNGALLIDDTYNANPVSVRAAIDVLSSFKGIRHVVLGDMAELGPDAEVQHAAMGHYAKERGIDYFWTVGSMSMAASSEFGTGFHFPSQTDLVRQLYPALTQGHTVLVKGSRSSKMELIVHLLMADEHTLRMRSITKNGLSITGAISL